MSNSFISDIAEIMDMNMGLLLKQTKITVLGRNIITIEGIENIIKYEPDAIILSKSRNKIEIIGENLGIRSLSKNDITVEGKIASINFI